MEDLLSREAANGARCSIVELVNGLIGRAVSIAASDVHVHPSANALEIRMRVDGLLVDQCELPKSVQNECIARIKVLAGLRTDERYAAQDGRFSHSHNGVRFDVRVSIVPTYHGEKCVLRILGSSGVDYSIESLGLSDRDRTVVSRAMASAHGMILATGPTGSGKTTTLYSLLRHIHAREISIVTIEDPIEYELPGVQQIPVNARSGITFSNGLRSLLRQDPDVIMVGEIRDAETAAIAVNTALTGHLLLSSLHTNDAATTLPRLLDMGIEPYLVATTVSVAIGQRLVRTICESCKVPIAMPEASAEHLFSGVGQSGTGIELFRGVGCDRCAGSGYRGRTGIYEVLLNDEVVSEAIIARRSAREIAAISVQRGMTTLRDDGMRKVRAGITTLDEVLRVTSVADRAVERV